MELDYNKLLDSAIEKLPKKAIVKDRFALPDVVTETQGNKTLLKNFGDLIAVLRREPKHLASYLFKELATRGSLQNSSLMLDSKVSRNVLMSKIEDYVKEFVNCKVCGEPDTKFVRESRFLFMVCEACGAKTPVRNV